ncbi:alpha/beta hydrolase [Pseudorhodobacter turbinis]|uniref:Alpha/beta hydrolase n=1 Tax=Pseudorhodobacter turbinis TaxID=2500533 RepID=A0A4P8EG69_9RHOB|nr:alpha/beta hydrolase [Pseudorhodobacter turbinis]QCO56140.1 alpha/beta hydrolase [Pseudorhodobacter turbinis]
MSYPAKYDTLLDAQTWEFIRKTESFYPPDAVGLGVADQRKVYDKMCRAFNAPHPPGLEVHDTTLDHIPLRHYRAAKDAPAQVLYLHGGGFVVGGLESHDSVCAEISARTGFDLTAVDYRLSPEHPFPQDLDDAVHAAKAQTGKPLILVGDSAGANLCAAVSAALIGAKDAPVGQVLIYPQLGATEVTPSMAAHANAPMLGAADCGYYASIRSAQNPKTVTDPRFSPLCAASFAELPPTVAISAECDPLADDAALYCAAITAAGGRALHIQEAGLVHGYLRARHSVDRAKSSFTRIINAVSTLARGEWPTV